MSSDEIGSADMCCAVCGENVSPPLVLADVHCKNAMNAVVCVECKDDLDMVSCAINANGLRWGKLSRTGEKWMESSGAAEYKNKIGGSIDVYLNEKILLMDKEAIFKDVVENYRFLENLEWRYFEIVARLIDNSYKKKICEVLNAFCTKSASVRYNGGMNYICLWLLLFLDKNSAFYMLAHIVENMLLPDFFSGSSHGNPLNGFYIESTVVAGFLENCVPGINLACMPSDQFADFFSLEIMTQLFVNTVSFDCCIFLWDKFMQEGSIALIRGVVSILALTENEIIQKKHPLNILKSLPSQKILSKLEEKYQEISEIITLKKVKRLRIRSRDFRSLQWHNCGKMHMKKLEKLSNLNPEEIDMISKIYTSYVKTKDYIHSDVSSPVKILINVNQSLKFKENINGISKGDFMQIISSANSSLKQSAGLIFERFDEDKSGFLDFRELIICFSILSKGSFEEKLKVCFDAYDDDCSGYLEMKEIDKIVESLIKPYKGETEDILAFDVKEVKNKFKMVCGQNNNMLFFKDFLSTIKADPLLFSCFFDHLNLEISDDKMGRKEFKEIKKIKKMPCKCLVT